MQISTFQTVRRGLPVGAISAVAVGCLVQWQVGCQPGNVWGLGVSLGVTGALTGPQARGELRCPSPQWKTNPPWGIMALSFTSLLIPCCVDIDEKPVNYYQIPTSNSI